MIPSEPAVLGDSVLRAKYHTPEITKVIPLENAAEMSLEMSSENPPDKLQSSGKYRWKVKLCWKMPLNPWWHVTENPRWFLRCRFLVRNILPLDSQSGVRDSERSVPLHVVYLDWSFQRLQNTFWKGRHGSTPREFPIVEWWLAKSRWSPANSCERGMGSELHATGFADHVRC